MSSRRITVLFCTRLSHKQFQKSLEQYQKFLSRQIFRGAKDFWPDSPKLARKKLHKRETSKKKLHVILGAIFGHIFRGLFRFSGFSEGFQRFCPDFHGFCLDFNQIKTSGVRLHSPQPRLQYQWSSI